MKLLVLAFALVTSILYSFVLPLWEGFDEPYHYGYAELVATKHRLPIIGRTLLPPDVVRAMHLFPTSESFPGAVSFHDWFLLGAQERNERLDQLRNSQNWTSCPTTQVANYEAQQAPLAYVLLAPVYWLYSRASIPARVLSLRIFAAVTATLLIYLASWILADTIGVSGVFQTAALFCLFAVQMLWASVAHVGNDWLAVPLALCFLAQLAATARNSNRLHALFLAVFLAAGLLTKAYFLAFVPVYVLLGAIRYRRLGASLFIPLIALPWYVRNWALYHSVSGTQESAAGFGFRQAIQTLPQIHWLSNSVDFLHWSLWTGNWAWLSFSKATLNIELIFVLLAVGLYIASFRYITTAEAWFWLGAACFLAALAYQTCMTWLDTHGGSLYPEPWYSQGLLAAIWLVLFRGLQTSGVPGRVCGIALCMISAWVAALTYVAKLLPWYGGASARANLPTVWRWWVENPSANLSEVVLGPLWLVYLLLGCFLILLVAVTSLNLYRLVREST